MFDNEIAINKLVLWQFDKIAADLSEADLFKPGAGHGHPPVWILGHLAICGELGVAMLGGELKHPRWVPLFGPGSSDRIEPTAALTQKPLVDATNAAYAELRERAAAADPAVLARPHGVKLLEGSPIETVDQIVALLMTNHFGFHLAQLSSCRRAAGFPALF